MKKKLFYIIFIAFVWAVHMPAAFAASDLLSFQYEEPVLDELKEAKSGIIASGLVDQIAGYMNTNLQLPEPVQILFTEDSEEGPYYDGESRKIVIPYAFWVECRKRFEKEYSSKSAGNVVDELCEAVMAHTLYHELGHALIDVCRLPVTGREENVADEFAVLMLVDSFQEGRYMALIAGDYFALEGSTLEEVTDEDLFDEHALDDQRFFTTFCVAYGVAPDDELKKEMLELDISEERLDTCVADAERRVLAWTTLLRPFERSQ